MENILTCHSLRSTGAHNKLKDGWICSSGFRMLVTCMLVRCHTVTAYLNKTEILFVFLITSAFRTKTRQNVCCEQGLWITPFLTKRKLCNAIAVGCQSMCNFGSSLTRFFQSCLNPYFDSVQLLAAPQFPLCIASQTKNSFSNFSMHTV